tara:strand:+ start:37554 stop:37913 length:360 start_codon:yes stop_codon:yes gene_type:complete
MQRIKTYIIDLDGTVIKHQPPAERHLPMEALNNSVDSLHTIVKEGHKIILMTARPLCCYADTVAGLHSLGIDEVFDQIIFGVGSGERVVVNDLKPESDTPTAKCVNLKRNKGFNVGDLK